jgi:hypothetical protein
VLVEKAPLRREGDTLMNLMAVSVWWPLLESLPVEE